MAHHKETTVHYNPTAFELGKMFFKAGRGYNPYTSGTPAWLAFTQGRLVAELEAEVAEDVSNAIRSIHAGSVTPHCSSYRLEADAELRRNQFHQ
jgi:hypothetical protein